MATVKTLDDTIDTVDKTNTATKTDAPAPATVRATTDAVTTPPDTKLVDPFAHYAARESESFFQGDYIKLDQKLGWIRGQNKEPIDTAEPWVANVYEARHGWIRFAKTEGDTIRREIVLIRECPELPSCPACGYVADDHDDKRCDWRATIYLLLRPAADPDDICCYTGGGKGARRAVGQLCGIYARPGADRKGKSPTLMLETRSFENNSGGTTIWPAFKIIGWEFFEPDTPVPDTVAVPIAPPTAPATKALPPKRSDMDDEIPFVIPFAITLTPILYLLLSSGLSL